MKGPRRRAVLVAGLMMASFAGAAAWRPTTRLADQRQKVDLERLFPKAFGGWSVDKNVPVQLVSPDTEALLSKIYNQTLSRTYVNPQGQRVMLSVAYGGDQSDATRAHRPEVCYPAQGFQLQSTRLDHLKLSQGVLPLNRLVAKLGARNEPVSYWITVGDRVTVTGTEQKLAQLSYSMRGMVPDGMLVRVSNIHDDVQAAYRAQDAFLKDLLAALPDGERSLVVGELR